MQDYHGPSPLISLRNLVKHFFLIFENTANHKNIAVDNLLRFHRPPTTASESGWLIFLSVSLCKVQL